MCLSQTCKRKDDEVSQRKRTGRTRGEKESRETNLQLSSNESSPLSILFSSLSSSEGITTTQDRGQRSKAKSKSASRPPTLSPSHPSFPRSPFPQNEIEGHSRIQSPAPLPNNDPPTRTISLPSVVLELRTELGLDFLGVLSRCEFPVGVGEASAIFATRRANPSKG